MSSNFVFVLITVGFIIVVALLLLENRRDNIKLRQLNAKIKDLIAGDYSEVVDMQGSPELTDMTNSINDLSEVIRLTHENLEQETKRLTSILLQSLQSLVSSCSAKVLKLYRDRLKLPNIAFQVKFRDVYWNFA